MRYMRAARRARATMDTVTMVTVKELIASLSRLSLFPIIFSITLDDSKFLDSMLCSFSWSSMVAEKLLFIDLLLNRISIQKI